MATSSTRTRAQALARQAVEAGAAYERAVAAREAAVAKRAAALGRLDEAVSAAEATVTEAVADTAAKLGAAAAATVLGLEETDIRRAVRTVAEAAPTAPASRREMTTVGGSPNVG